MFGDRIAIGHPGDVVGDNAGLSGSASTSLCSVRIADGEIAASTARLCPVVFVA